MVIELSLSTTTVDSVDYRAYSYTSDGSDGRLVSPVNSFAIGGTAYRIDEVNYVESEPESGVVSGEFSLVLDEGPLPSYVVPEIFGTVYSLGDARYTYVEEVVDDHIYTWTTGDLEVSEDEQMTVTIRGPHPVKSRRGDIVKATIPPDGRWYEFEFGATGTGDWFRSLLEVDSWYRISFRADTFGLTPRQIELGKHLWLRQLLRPNGTTQTASPVRNRASDDRGGQYYTPGGTHIVFTTADYLRGSADRRPGEYLFNVSAPSGLAPMDGAYRYWVKLEGSTDGIMQGSWSESRSGDFPSWHFTIRHDFYTPGKIGPASTAHGTSLPGTSDRDSYLVRMRAGNAYFFRVTGMSSPDITLFNPRGESGNAAFLDQKSASLLHYVPAETGPYFFTLYDDGRGGDGRYSISLDEVRTGAGVLDTVLTSAKLGSRTGYCAPSPSTSTECVAQADNAPGGSLDDGSVLGGEPYTVLGIASSGNNFHLALDREISDEDRSRTLLIVGDTPLRLSEATVSAVRDGVFEYTWRYEGLGIQSGQSVRLRITYQAGVHRG